MKSWKHWPYWVRGGVIGGMTGIISFLVPYLCNLAIGAENFLCLPLTVINPFLPIFLLSDKLDSFFNYSFSFLGLILLGILIFSGIGMLIGLATKKFLKV